MELLDRLATRLLYLLRGVEAAVRMELVYHEHQQQTVHLLAVVLVALILQLKTAVPIRRVVGVARVEVLQGLVALLVVIVLLAVLEEALAQLPTPKQRTLAEVQLGHLAWAEVVVELLVHPIRREAPVAIFKVAAGVAAAVSDAMVVLVEEQVAAVAAVLVTGALVMALQVALAIV